MKRITKSGASVVEKRRTRVSVTQASKLAREDGRKAGGCEEQERRRRPAGERVGRAVVGVAQVAFAGAHEPGRDVADSRRVHAHLAASARPPRRHR